MKPEIGLAKETLEDLKSIDCIQAIFLFGSRASGEYKKKSDIDLAISCPNASPKDWSKIMEIIENSKTLLKIDCVRLDQLSESSKLRENILNKSKTLFIREI